MAGGIKIRQYMRTIVEEHRDITTGEVNTTTLAEDACQHFDDYGPAPEHEIPDKYFEFAYEISRIAERRVNLRASFGNVIDSRNSSFF